MPSTKLCVTGFCGRKNVTLHVVNTLKETNFDITHEVMSTNEKYLLGVMEEAADSDSSFRWANELRVRVGSVDNDSYCWWA